jgi:hypothetical protein
MDGIPEIEEEALDQDDLHHPQREGIRLFESFAAMAL